MGDDYDFLFKTLLVGDSGVGKSGILLKYMSNAGTTPISAIGVDFQTNRLELESKMIKWQIWDTAGQERFKTVARGCIRGAHGVVFVFDVTNKSSFENIQEWFEHVVQIGVGAGAEEQEKVEVERIQSKNAKFNKCAYLVTSSI